jgi:hypothetical protein
MTDTDHDDRLRRLASAQAAAVQQGRRQFELLVRLLGHRVQDGGGDLEAAVAAARRTARFAGTEGWVQGPAWTAYGTEWLLATWALRHGHTSAEVGDTLRGLDERARQRRREAAQAAGTEEIDAPAGVAEARRARAVRRARRGAALRRGLEQVEALDTLLRELTEGSDDLERAVPAAGRAAAFATGEGWVLGTVWSAAGPQLLLARWALEQGIAYDQLVHHFDTHRHATGDAASANAAAG